MIDTDKYERTTPELEEFEGENLGDLITNLLTEVKRLREGIKSLAETTHNDTRGKYLIDVLMEMIE